MHGNVLAHCQRQHVPRQGENYHCELTPLL